MQINDSVVGLRFGMLTIVSLANFNKHHQRRVNCICDCGNEKIVVFNRLKQGETQSCGCLRIANANAQLVGASQKNPKIKGKSEPRIATAKIVYGSRYSDGDLSFEDFLILSQKNCFYCGLEPSNTTNYYVTKDKRYSSERRLNGFFTYNGLDRVDSRLPHNIDNIVPCCIHCNKAKLDRNQEDFFKWVSKVYHLHPYR